MPKSVSYPNWLVFLIQKKKRKIIGNEFVYVFDDEATKLAGEEGVSFLAQGTLYTDVIESGTETAQTDQISPQRRRSA